MSRRQVLAGAGGTGLLAAAASPAKATTRARRARAGRGGGTPEQIHLTWSENPATGVVVSWASPGQARRPRVRIGQRVIPAEPRPYTDGISGETVWTYHARSAPRPGATYAYAVTADNDSDAADPFSSTFRTAPAGQAPFRFTSFGDWPPRIPPGCSPTARAPTRSRRWSPSSRCSTCSTATCATRT